MKRWFYILLGGIGMCLTGTAVFLLWLSPTLPPSYTLRAQIGEGVLILSGVVLAIIGFVNGRHASEFGDGFPGNASRRRDHHVAGQEIEFKCPSCSKNYRASPMLAGKPFSCRDCNEVFDVPTEMTSAPAQSSPA